MPRISQFSKKEGELKQATSSTVQSKVDSIQVNRWRTRLIALNKTPIEVMSKACHNRSYGSWTVVANRNWKLKKIGLVSQCARRIVFCLKFDARLTSGAPSKLLKAERIALEQRTTLVASDTKMPRQRETGQGISYQITWVSTIAKTSTTMRLTLRGSTFLTKAKIGANSTSSSLFCRTQNVCKPQMTSCNNAQTNKCSSILPLNCIQCMVSPVSTPNICKSEIS